jgi:hypothetical protein
MARPPPPQRSRGRDPLQRAWGAAMFDVSVQQVSTSRARSSMNEASESGHDIRPAARAALAAAIADGFNAIADRLDARALVSTAAGMAGAAARGSVGWPRAVVSALDPELAASDHSSPDGILYLQREASKLSSQYSASGLSLSDKFRGNLGGRARAFRVASPRDTLCISHAAEKDLSTFNGHECDIAPNAKRMTFTRSKNGVYRGNAHAGMGSRPSPPARLVGPLGIPPSITLQRGGSGGITPIGIGAQADKRSAVIGRKGTNMRLANSASNPGALIALGGDQSGATGIVPRSTESTILGMRASTEKWRKDAVRQRDNDIHEDDDADDDIYRKLSVYLLRQRQSLGKFAPLPSAI